MAEASRMSITWFDGLLMQRDDAGIYFLPVADVDELAEAAAVNRFALLRVDFRGDGDKDALLARFQSALALPAHFGRNWDALADALGDLRGGDVPGVVLLLEHSGKLRREATADFKRAMEVLQGACREWAGRGVPFWAFVVLPDAEFDAL
jgi:RNAse (barnase) inhibitor barstar